MRELGSSYLTIVGLLRAGVLVSVLTIVLPRSAYADASPMDGAACYYAVHLADGAMWVPCEFDVRIRNEPSPMLELSSPSAMLKQADLLREPAYRAVIYVGGKNIVDLRLGQGEIGRLGAPTTRSFGRVKVTAWPNAYGPFKPSRYVSLITHGEAGVLVISATSGLTEQLAASIHPNDQPVKVQ